MFEREKENGKVNLKKMTKWILSRCTAYSQALVGLLFFPFMIMKKLVLYLHSTYWKDSAKSLTLIIICSSNSFLIDTKIFQLLSLSPYPGAGISESRANVTYYEDRSTFPIAPNPISNSQEEGRDRVAVGASVNSSDDRVEKLNERPCSYWTSLEWSGIRSWSIGGTGFEKP